MKCSRCISAWYCSRTCQVEHWKFHKKVCKTLEKERYEAVANDLNKAANNGFPELPWTGIALSKDLTGFPQEVICHIAPRFMEDKDARGEVGDYSVDSADFRKRVAKCIKYFFQTYQTSTTAASQISVIDVGNMCQDAVLLFWFGDSRVRQITIHEGMPELDKFAIQFFNLSPIAINIDTRC